MAIIGARGGSKGLPKKNIKPLLGKPLIYYTVKAALDSKYVNRIIVSTDDKNIAKVARDCGAETPFLRPAEISQNNSSVSEFLKHAMDWLEENEGYSPDIVVYLQVTDIFRKKGMIDRVVEMLLEDDNLESVFVAKPTHKKFWEESEDGKGFVRLRENFYINRQKSPMWYREDTGIACATRASLVKRGVRVGDKVKILVNNDDNTDIDIHDKHDLWMAEQVLLKEKKEKGEKSEYYF